jgi:nucleotide-binding universal stress UspA family protein
MTNLNTFESVFKSADKPVFEYAPVTVDRVLLVTDLTAGEAGAMVPQLRQFLAAVDDGRNEWKALGAADFDNVKALLDQVEEYRPDLIVSWRHLRSDAWKWPFSLGEYLDVLVQATTSPVIILPHPDAGHALPHSVRDTNRVMAMTDHLAGDSRLVNAALAFTHAGGRCWLTHVESDHDFERYIEVISKIPSIDTEDARETIKAQLLKEPRDFIGRCREAVEAQKLPITVEELVTTGHRMSEYRQLIEEQEIDLLVMYARDEHQLAMHGRTYPLAVELRQIPLLML